MTNVLEGQDGRPYNRAAGEGLDYVVDPDDPQDTVRYGRNDRPYPTLEIVPHSGVIRVGTGIAAPVDLNSSPGSAATIIPFQIPFERDGSLAGLAGLAGIDHAPVGFVSTLTSVEVFLTDSPAGGDVVIDINRASDPTGVGTSVFTDQSKRPRITPGNFYVKVTDIDITDWAATDFAVVAVDETGALNTEGGGLRVWLRFVTSTEGSVGAGLSVPHGGHTDDRLTKLSDADGDFAWVAGAPGDTEARLVALETAIDGGTAAVQGTAIRVRHGIAADWTSNDPVLEVGEHGYETNTGLFKIGDGTSFWTALAYANDAQGAIFSSDTSAALHILAGDADPNGTLTLLDRYLWIDEATGAVKRWNAAGSAWVTVLQAAGALDATDIAFDDAPYTNVSEALTGLDGQNVNFDQPGHRDRNFKTNGDTPDDHGVTPTVGDYYVDLETGIEYDYVPDITGLPVPGAPSLNGDWIDGGTVGEPFIDVLIDRVADRDAAIATAIGGLNIDVVQALFARTITLTGGSGGTFTLTYQGQTTAGIAYNASAATVASAVQALSTVVTATGTGGPMNTSPVVIKIDAASETGALMTGSAASVTGSPVFAISAAFDVSNKIDKSVMTAGGDLITRQSGVPVRLTRATLAADPAFSDLYAPIGSVDTIGGRSFSGTTDLLATDSGKYVASNGGSGFQQVNVPKNTTEPIDVFKVFEVRQATDAPLVLVFETGVVFNSLGDSQLAAGKGAAIRLHKTSTDGWFVTGALAQ